MNNILITGAAGFIASHLIEELLKDSNNKIYGLDNFYSGTKSNLEFIHSIDKNCNFKFFTADIRNFDQINKIMSDNKINQVYHLAAIASVQTSINNPLLSNDVNLKGTLHILEASKQNNIKRVVFSSSAAVYGDDPILPKSETSLTKPISPYGYEKLMSEYYLKLYNELYGLETVSLRYFNVYGERQSATSEYSGVISIFDNKFKNNQIPITYGSGVQYRDFINVKDVVNANIQAMNTPNISGELFCVGTGEKTSINDLFNAMKAKYNKDYKQQFQESRSGDIVESVCNNTKIKKILKIENFQKLQDGILKI